MPPDNNGNGNDYKGMLTAKIKEAAREVAREEIERCPIGNNNKKDIEQMKGDLKKMETEIKAGFENQTAVVKAEFKAHAEAAEKKEKKQETKKIWTLDKVIIIVIAVVTIAAQFLK